MDSSENDNIINLKDFDEKTIPLSNIFLDPNNPRFSNREVLISENKIMDGEIQERCLKNMEAFAVKELKDSISRVGFLPIDKIVVRPIRGAIDSYVVVEGNRRVTALKQLKREYEMGEVSLSKEVLESILNIKGYIYKGKEVDIAWMIQGIRHISGVRNWKPYQQAKLLVKLISERNTRIEEAGKIVGIGSIKSARLIRSYYAFEQSTKEEEFSEYLTDDHFSFFQEAIFTAIDTPMQKWMEWSEKDKEFKNLSHLRKYLSWIVKTEDKPARIDRALDVRDVIAKSVSQYPILFQKFESDESMSIKDLEYQIWSIEEQPREIKKWLDRLRELSLVIEDLPDVKIEKSPEYAHFIKLLLTLKEAIEAHLEILDRK